MIRDRQIQLRLILVTGIWMLLAGGIVVVGVGMHLPLLILLPIIASLAILLVRAAIPISKSTRYMFTPAAASIGALPICFSCTWLFAAGDATGTHIFYDFWHYNPLASYVPLIGGVVGAVIVAALMLLSQSRHDR